ncbi:MAG TPA: hypothetical protein VH640_14910 [Bryobacteraceae bacterium]|jgi:hypothetical protein
MLLATALYLGEYIGEYISESDEDLPRPPISKLRWRKTQCSLAKLVELGRGGAAFATILNVA